MTALLRLEVENFLSLRNVRLDLRPLNVLVGPNAAGKTNLLSVIAFLGECARLDLPIAVDERGGFSAVRFRGASERPIRIKVGAVVTKHAHAGVPDEYTLVFEERRVGSKRVLIRSEEFQFKRTPKQGRRITVRGGKIDVSDHTTRQLPLIESSLALSTLPKLTAGQGGDQVAKFADLFMTFRVFDVNVEAVRRPTAGGATDRLAPDGSNLASFLRYLAEAHAEAFAALKEDARHFVPGLRDVVLSPASGAERGWQIELDEAGLRGPTPLRRASFGTVRALALLALLHDPSPPKITCIEEVDHGLHPYVFDRLVDRIRQASARTQFLIATHSPALVNRLRAGELIVCERDTQTGASRIPAIDAETVRKMEAAAEPNLRLGELWFSGSLGGVP